MIEKYLHDTIAKNRKAIVEKFEKLNLIPPRIYKEMKSVDSMLHSKDSAYLIAKGYITLIRDTMEVDKTDEEAILDELKKGKDKQRKDSGDKKMRINTEAILPNEKKKPEVADTLNN